MVLCLGEPPRRFLLYLHFHFIFVSSFCCHLSTFFHSHLLFNIIPHPSVDYRRVFTPGLYFQPSPVQSDSRYFHFSTFPGSSYRERYGFEWALFTHIRFLLYAPSPTFLIQPTFIKASCSGTGSWSVGSPRFICLGINFSDHLDRQINNP